MTVVNTGITHRLAALLLLGSLAVPASPLLAQSSAQGQPPTARPTQSAPATKPTGTAPAKPAQPTATAPAPGALPANVTPAPADYIIGSDDVLQIVFWREKDLSAEVTVRPDGKISLPLMNDVQASGLTPEQLRTQISDAAGRFVTDPSVTIVVKTINSRKVYVTGQVNKPGTFALTDSMTVLQMLALAGGVQEYADAEHILVMRTEQGQTKSYRFNYKDVRKGKNLQQNILLKPGDTIVIP